MCPTCGEYSPDEPVPGTSYTVGYVNDLAEALRGVDRDFPTPRHVATWATLSELLGHGWTIEDKPLPPPVRRECCEWNT